MTIANQFPKYNVALSEPAGPATPGLCYIRWLRRAEFKIVSRQGLEWIESASLHRRPWLLHAFSTRRGGVSQPPAAGLNLGFIKSDRRARVEENRRLLFQALGNEHRALATVNQIHSSIIYRVSTINSGKLEYQVAGSSLPRRRQRADPAGDALITDQPGILLSIRTADCMPIFLVDLERRAVGAVHAGWRGALDRIVEKTVGEMRRAFGTRSRDLRVAIGPSIRACCYEVGEEIFDQFASRFAGAERFFQKATRSSPTAADRYPLLFLTAQPPGHERANVPALHLDLVAVAREQLKQAGVPRSNIEVAGFCTACRTDLFFSHRKEGPATGRMMAVIGSRNA